MKTKIIPFDLETAKKIQAGEIEGKIKTRDSKDVKEIAFFGIPLEYNIYAVINGKLHSFTKKGFERSWDERGIWCGDLVIEVPDNESQFKPFDKVLIRDNENDFWRATFFSHYNKFYNAFPYCTVSGLFAYCIPYEGNEYLIGTTDKPKEE